MRLVEIDINAIVVDVGELHAILKDVDGPGRRGDIVRLKEIETLVSQALLYARNISR